MCTIFKHELKSNLKSLIIWTACVGGFGFFCIVLFSSVKESMSGMAESFASMGAFADAFGMSQLSIATLAGFYATEVGTIHALGGAMFAAIISTCMLSKEEDGHTSEFLYSLPLSRTRVISAKLLAIIVNVFIFNAVCVGVYLIGIAVLGEEMPLKEFFIYHAMQPVMQSELAVVCFAVSAFMKKNKLGIGLGAVLLLYAYDLIARVVPDLSETKIISPFAYANAADILSAGEVDITALLIGMIVILVGIVTAYIVYNKKDLAA